MSTDNGVADKKIVKLRISPERLEVSTSTIQKTSLQAADNSISQNTRRKGSPSLRLKISPKLLKDSSGASQNFKIQSGVRASKDSIHQQQQVQQIPRNLIRVVRSNSPPFSAIQSTGKLKQMNKQDSLNRSGGVSESADVADEDEHQSVPAATASGVAHGSHRYRKDAQRTTNSYFQSNFVTVNTEVSKSKNILPVKSINFLNKKSTIEDDYDHSPPSRRESAKAANALAAQRSQGTGIGFKSSISHIKIVKKKSQSPESAG